MTTFLTSDTHFGHQLLTKEERRPWDNVEDMNEALIANWNSVVGPKDLVYHLGDVVINRRYLNQVLPRLNGRKKLIKGNHDNFRIGEYLEHFEDVAASVTFSDCVLTHIPVHPNQLGRFKVNVHGHMHQHVVQVENVFKRFPGPDLRYINVCVEQTQYKPVSYDEVRKMIDERFPRQDNPS